MANLGDDSDLNSTDFEQLLAFLNRNSESPDLPRETILRMRGEKYESVRRSLILRFRGWGCLEPESLADETFNRAAKKIPSDYGPKDDPEHFLYRVAYFIRLESFRQKRRIDPIPNIESDEGDEQALECLDQCMDKLISSNRELIIEYYRDDKRAKIDHRKEIADKFGIRLNALRIRAYRIRAVLQDCVFKCMEFNRLS